MAYGWLISGLAVPPIQEYLADIAHAAVFLASDQAGMITGVTMDVTGGTTAGLNYWVPPLASPLASSR